MSTPDFDKAPGGEPAGADPFGPPPSGYGTPPPAAPSPYGGGYGSSPYGAPPAYGAPAPYGAPSGGVEGPGGEWLGPPLASWGARVGATLVDYLVIVGIAIVGGILTAVLSAVSDAGAVVGLVLLYIGIFAFQAYQLVVQGRTGQTIGKRALGIKLLRIRDGQPVGAGLSIGRAFVHALDVYSFLIGYLWPLWDKKNQTFADKCLGTVVIKV